MKIWFSNWWKKWWLGLKFAMKYLPFFWVGIIGIATFYILEILMENGFFSPKLILFTIFYIFIAGIIFRYVREAMINRRKDLAGKMWHDYQSENSNHLN